jgi:hypothetical protein
MERAFLVDRHLFLRHTAEHLGGGADVDDRIFGMLLQRVEHPHGALDVGVESIERRREAGLRETLRREMKDIVRTHLGNRIVDRETVA